MDRGYAKFTLWNAIVKADSSYVCRVRDNSKYDILESRKLSAEAAHEGVLSDEIVQPGRKSKPDHTVRLVSVRATPHTSRGRGTSTGPGCDGVLRIATSRPDIPAELISQLYRHRWLIELFFRMFRQLPGCRHLLSTKQNGVGIQAYCAIIACLLILIHTGRTPTKRTFEMICFSLSGWASLDELQRHIEKLAGFADRCDVIGRDHFDRRVHVSHSLRPKQPTPSNVSEQSTSLKHHTPVPRDAVRSPVP